jgi:hypothetical protein
VNAFGNVEFDYVITLCDNAKESGPYFPARNRVMHKGIDDPPKLAVGARHEEEAMAHYRRICDEIRAFVENLPEEFNNPEKWSGIGIFRPWYRLSYWGENTGHQKIKKVDELNAVAISTAHLILWEPQEVW